MGVLYQVFVRMSSLLCQKILEIATTLGEVLCVLQTGEGDRGGVVTNHDVFHGCIITGVWVNVKP